MEAAGIEPRKISTAAPPVRVGRRSRIVQSLSSLTRRLSNEDPAVQAGRLAVELMTWMVPAGNVRFENVPAPRSMAESAGEETR